MNSEIELQDDLIQTNLLTSKRCILYMVYGFCLNIVSFLNNLVTINTKTNL